MVKRDGALSSRKRKSGPDADYSYLDDEYHLNAGAVCLPGFWRLREKFGMSLDTLHFEAKVPHYGAKLQKSMNRFFKTMTPEKPVTRNNVGCSIILRIEMIADQFSSSFNSMTDSTGHIVWGTRRVRKLLVSLKTCFGNELLVADDLRSLGKRQLERPKSRRDPLQIRKTDSPPPAPIWSADVHHSNLL